MGERYLKGSDKRQTPALTVGARFIASGAKHGTLATEQRAQPSGHGHSWRSESAGQELSPVIRESAVWAGFSLCSRATQCLQRFTSDAGCSFATTTGGRCIHVSSASIAFVFASEYATRLTAETRRSQGRDTMHKPRETAISGGNRHSQYNFPGRKINADVRLESARDVPADRGVNIACGFATSRVPGVRLTPRQGTLSRNRKRCKCR